MMNYPYEFAATLILITVVFSIPVGILSKRYGFSFLNGFINSLFFTPLVAAALLYFQVQDEKQVPVYQRKS
ncbi:MAG: hypothetical protein AAFN93_10605 [Bacteroidota bacterium]